MNRRKDKIQFLKGLAKGTRSLHEIGQPAVVIEVGASGGVYKYLKTGKVLTYDEQQRYHDFMRNKKKVKIKVTHI